MSKRTYSIIAVADDERTDSGDAFLIARIGPICANAEEAALWYERGMRQREYRAKALAEVLESLRPAAPDRSTMPRLALIVLAWSLGVIVGRMLA